MTNHELFFKLKSAAESLAKDENLNLVSIKRNPHRKNVVGLCTSGGHISIRMPSSQYMSQEVKVEEAGRTIAHELAHLKYMNHKKEFWEYSFTLCKKLSDKLGVSIPPEKIMI